MKRAVPIILCGFLLAGCSDKSSSSDNSSELETTTAATTSVVTTAPTTTASVTTDDPIDHSYLPGSADHDIGKATAYWTDDGISVGVWITDSYYLSKDISVETYDKTKNIAVLDLDFDGYDEIFVPTDEYGEGKYYHLNLGRTNFESWDVMNDLTGGRFVTIADDEKLLCLTESLSRSTCNKYYKWENKAPVFVNEEICYMRDYYYCDTYDIQDGEKVLVSRKLKSNEGDKIIDHPIYFHVNSDSIDVLKAGEAIQNIPDIGLYSLSERYGQYMDNNDVGWQPFQPEEMIYESDYDSDGYNDFCIPVDLKPIGENKYIYFRFDPAENKYFPWDELNNIGKKLVMYRNEDYIEAEDPGTGLDRYKWENGKLVFQEHIDGVRIHD
ncbi:MAG: hypothetical protein GXY08_06605 [Ruminococcus sp.]|nr:hypothetical protein [Ruminococcus sp.]